ncbi:MAG: UDP-N-acetylmuramoyl-tripeptide--D-alanyl-D-alanine ligase [Candidatus Kapaibacterium sp.]
MNKNKAPFDRAELSVIFGEDALVNFPASFAARGVTTDTRLIESGNIFIAIRGERVDAHNLVGQAYDCGAACVIVEQSWFQNNQDKIANRPAIVTDTADSALVKLGRFHRNRFDIPIVGVAGSNGKTTTKDMIAAVLMEKFSVLKTWGNFNNQLGLPLMLLELDESHQIAVLEIGTNHPGEVGALSEVARPTEGVITNIGEEHLEFLLDLDGVEMEETALYGSLIRRGRPAFVNVDDPRLAKYLRLIEQALTYGTNPEAQLSASIEMDDELLPRVTYKYNDKEFSAQLHTIGYGSALNSIPAVAAGLYFGLTQEQIKAGLEKFRQPKLSDYGRMLLENAGGVRIINDTYNSNPPSARLALDTLAAFGSAGRKFCAMADMRELGEAAAQSHIDIIKYASEKSDTVCLFGDEMRKAMGNIYLGNVEFFMDKNELINRLISEMSEGDVLLVKGSRGMKMEEVVNKIKKNYENGQNSPTYL